MALNRFRDSFSTFRPLEAIGVAVFLLIVVLLVRNLDTQKNYSQDSPRYSPLPTVTSDNTRTSRGRIVSRLEEILQAREAAYHFRNTELLREIYSEDCPCLANDKQAIDELIETNRIWAEIETSINVRSTKEVNDRLWIVVALFSSKSLRVETEGGKLVKTEPPGSDLFEFTLVKPHGGHDWLLGFVTILEGSR